MDYLRCLSLAMWCLGHFLTIGDGQYFSDKNGYTFPNDLFNEWELKNESLQRNPFHNIYIIKGPAGETQRVHYAIDDYGVRANVFTKHAQPDIDTSSFGLRSRESPTKLKNDFLTMKPLQTRVPMPKDIISFTPEKIHFSETTNFSPSKLVATLPDSNVTLNHKNPLIGQLTRKFSSGFSTKEALMQPITSNSSVGMKLVKDSRFSVTHPPHQYFVRANLSNENINLQNSSSRHLPIISFKAIINNEKENITEFQTDTNVPIEQYSENVSSIDGNDSVAPSMTTDSINNDSSLTTFSSWVDERELAHSLPLEKTSANSTRLHLEKDFNSTINITIYNSEFFEPIFTNNQSRLTIHLNNSFINSEYDEENSDVSMEATTIIPQIVNKSILSREINSNNTSNRDEVYLSLLNSTDNGTNMIKSMKYNRNNWTESNNFSEILLPMLLKEANQSMKGNETIAKLNNTLTTDETESPEIVTRNTNFHSTEIIETKSNSSSQVDHNNSSHSAENISTINRQPIEFLMEIVEEVSPANETSFREIIDVNETSKNSAIFTTKHTGSMALGNHTKQSTQERVDKVYVYDINNPFFTNQSTLTESKPELDDRKSSEISQKNKTDFNKMKTSEDFAPPMFHSIDNQNFGHSIDLANKVRLYPKEFNNTLKVNNAFLKLWRGKSGVRIEPFGVNRAYKMIPVLQ
ncbi:uncharacterized protein TNIN_391061 [Trichonephila inaurata madagascariensis]|uniref:Uncharacterized protein n=1 Tax=Trichonephila inaurata madagascariensis TaxID=2747483 RepID=A0A8X7BRE2_9ARAC|nr:uncharacterized protein TNIN_391061 [Trichonephila inaurata madagascariensis]